MYTQNSERAPNISAFLYAHEEAILNLSEEAQRAVGGHYALRTPEEARDIAWGDGREYLTDLYRGYTDSPKLSKDLAVAQISGVNIEEIESYVMGLAALLDPFFVQAVHEATNCKCIAGGKAAAISCRNPLELTWRDLLQILQWRNRRISIAFKLLVRAEHLRRCAFLLRSPGPGRERTSFSHTKESSYGPFMVPSENPLREGWGSGRPR